MTAKADRMWLFAGRAMIALTVPALFLFGSWLSGLADRIENNHDRVTLIEQTRFTAEMGREMEARLMKFMESHYPPPWLRQAVDRLEVAADRLTEETASLEKRMIRIEAKIDNGK